jgi:Skp family chaperone for outer membrane proteins
MRPLKTMIVITALSLALAAGPAFAQTPPAAGQAAPQTPAAAPADQPAPRPFPEGAKVAYIDLQYIATTSTEGRAATAKIQEFSKKKMAELEAKQKALEAARNKLLQGGTVLSDQARSQLEKDIDKMNRELQFAQQDAQAEQQQLTNDLQQEFQLKLNPIIDAVAKEKNLHLVLSIADSGAVWVDTGLNISVEVMKRLDAGVKAPAPAPAPPAKK